MKTRSIILHPHEIPPALAGTLGLVVRPVSLRHVHDIDDTGTPMRECKDGIWREATSPLGVPGDRLRCRESYYIQDTHGQHRADGLRWGSWSGLPTTISPDGKRIVYYKEGFDRCAPCWRSPATMPAWASRITLEVVGVRCVRPAWLTEEDAAKAVESHHDGERMWFYGPGNVEGHGNPLHAFKQIWQHYYGRRYPWGTSWAWAVEVRRVEG